MKNSWQTVVKRAETSPKTAVSQDFMKNVFENEQKIMNEIFSFSHSKTLIIITHRHQTVQNCDNIFLLDQVLMMKDLVLLFYQQTKLF